VLNGHFNSIDKRFDDMRDLWRADCAGSKKCSARGEMTRLTKRRIAEIAPAEEPKKNEKRGGKTADHVERAGRAKTTG
jgi:hypothetical protein